MELLIQKYGGTSVGTTDRIGAVAARIAAAHRAGSALVVVVSAMADTTDDLVSLARRIHPDPPARELDMLLTAGERISMALLSMALHHLGVDAVSFTGSQSGILTDNQHADAKILAVRGDRIRESLQAGRVVIVAGFQGVSSRREITTLGRGGSDTTAVALAAARGAERCEIYTDVDGVHSADPRVVPQARRIPALSYQEMLELAASGARVLHPRSVDVGWRFEVPIHVLTSFADGKGTVIRPMETIESSRVRGIACDPEIAILCAATLPSDGAARLLAGLGDAGIRTLLVVCGASEFACAVARGDLARAQVIWDAEIATLGSRSETHDDVAAVTVVGHAVHSHPGVTAQILSALSEWPVRWIATSAAGMTCIVPRAAADDATRRLHSHLGLDTP